MISVVEAVEIIQTHWLDFGETLVSVDDSQRAILMESIMSDRDYPPCDRVMMDGIAVAWSEYNLGRRQFKILGTVAAGDRPISLSNPAGCLEVMTGAMLPKNCDLIIPYEDLTIKDQLVEIIGDRQRTPLEFVHSKRSDCLQGTAILKPLSKLNGPAWSIISSFGKIQVKVKKSPVFRLFPLVMN